MEDRVPARLTAAEGRKFGFTVGLAFAVIGGLLFWRGRVERSYVAFALSAPLMLAALVAPTRLGPLERAWMGLAHVISKVTTPIFMGVVYFAVITPIGLVRRLSGGSPIVGRGGSASRWEAHKPAADPREGLERQF